MHFFSVFVVLGVLLVGVLLVVVVWGGLVVSDGGEGKDFHKPCPGNAA